MSVNFHETTIYHCPDCNEYYKHVTDANRCCNGFGSYGYECETCGKVYDDPSLITCCPNKE